MNNVGQGCRFIRRDINSRNQEHHDVYLTNREKMVAILGVIIYVTLFIVIIPITLYKVGFTTFLKLYFLNTDLIATVISFDKGIFKNLFKYLYNDTGPFIGFISQSIINWSVLMGLFFIIATEAKKKQITTVLSKVAFILFITYLLPGRYIIKLQEWFYNFVNQKTTNYNIKLSGILSILFGFILVILLITFEDYSIYFLSDYVKKIFDNIFKLLK